MSNKAAPLDGVRALDLTTFWAGPQPAAILADFGAEVIKIEAIQRLDPFRAYGAPTNPTPEPAYEWSSLFNAVNRNKRGITLNLTSDEGRNLFKKLLVKSHVVLENYSPRVLTQFGLSYEVLREINPAVVLTSVSGFGQTGPWRDYVSFAAIGEALSGISSLTGYTDEGVLLQGVGVSDPYTGLTAAFATLSALYVARETGKGQHIDVSQLEASLPFIADVFMDFSLNQRTRIRRTNEDPARAPHGCFPAKGDDNWIAISIGTQTEWQNLVEVMGKPDWAAAETFATPLNRYRNRKALNDLVAQWTSSQDKDHLARELQAKKVSAAPVRTPSEQLGDPQLEATSFFQFVERRYCGRQPYPSFPVRFDGTYPRIHRAGPTVGEDNHYVFTELLGLNASELERLRKAGVIGTEPIR
ncbi:MAG TPA: CoA transferase [Candidatus Binataceae bacterium]|nr:CoA transferase [Candidatus Binataceae bacterium]